MKSQLRPRGDEKTTSNDREKAGDAGVFIDGYCSMEVEALQAWRAWQETKTEQQSETAWILSWSWKRRCGSPEKGTELGSGSPKLGRGLRGSPHFGSLETRLCARCGH